MSATVWRRSWPWAVCAGLVLVWVTVWWFPARWAWAWMDARHPAVTVQSVHGSIWHGRMEGVRVAKMPLGSLRWDFGRAALWGDMHGQFELDGPVAMADGHIRRAADGSIVLREVTFEVHLQALPLAWPGRQPPGGVLAGNVTRARLVHGWPRQLRADLHWRDARVNVAGRWLDLGTLAARWRATDQGNLRADLGDAGDGPLRLRGRMLVGPLGWRLDADLTTRGHHPALRAWLRRLGTPDDDGHIHLRRHTGLLMEK